MQIPMCAQDFTPQWINKALQEARGPASVTTCVSKKSDIPGQTAEVVMLEVTWDQPTDLPDRMVAKITSENPEILTMLIANYDQYRRETSFYREFPNIGIPVPRCLHLDHDPSTQAFVLLMSDLAPAQSPSWAITPDQVELALSALPAFHAKWWNNNELRQKDWMVQGDDSAFFAAAYGAARRGAEGARQHFEDPEYSVAALSYADENREALLQWVRSRPYTFVHGDYHAKQMFFPTNAGGEFSVIDWQFPFVGSGAWDFARLESMCLDTSDRHDREARLMQAYVKGLENHGVSNYSQVDFEDDYRYGLLISQVIMGVAHADTDVTLFEKECGDLGVDWRDATLMRTQNAMEEWGVVDFLKQL